jgi:hypothetical protein
MAGELDETSRVTRAGLNDTSTCGFNVIDAEAACVGAATLVAVMAMVWVTDIHDGAVYRPLAVIVPTCGVINQVTLWSTCPVIVAVNCSACKGTRVATPGLTDTALVPWPGDVGAGAPKAEIVITSADKREATGILRGDASPLEIFDNKRPVVLTERGVLYAKREQIIPSE